MVYFKGLFIIALFVWSCFLVTSFVTYILFKTSRDMFKIDEYRDYWATSVWFVTRFLPVLLIALLIISRLHYFIAILSLILLDMIFVLIQVFKYISGRFGRKDWIVQDIMKSLKLLGVLILALGGAIL